MLDADGAAGRAYLPVLANGNPDVDEVLAGVGADTAVPEPTFGGPGDAPREPSVTAADLDALRVEAHAYSKSAKGTLAALAGLLGFDADAAEQGLEHEASRYALVPIDGDSLTATRFYKVGCAARLFVVTSRISVRVQLTLPQLAAAAELGYTQGRMMIEVRGYTGPFGAIPAPAGLSVESFGEYVAAFRAIQAAVFAPENASYLRPRLLGVVAG